MDKVCPVCQESKPLTDYYKNNRNKNGFDNRCKPCKRSTNKVYYKASPETIEKTAERLKNYAEANKEKITKYQQDRNRFKKYGLLAGQYDEMVTSQCGLCFICDALPADKYADCAEWMQRLVVHHNHKTGKVIALVCQGCNSGMGLLQDSPDLLRRAATLNEMSSIFGGEAS